MRYQKPQQASSYTAADWESRELLGICLKRVRGLSHYELVNAKFVYTEPHSRRILLRLTVPLPDLRIIGTTYPVRPPTSSFSRRIRAKRFCCQLGFLTFSNLLNFQF